MKPTEPPWLWPSAKRYNYTYTYVFLALLHSCNEKERQTICQKVEMHSLNDLPFSCMELPSGISVVVYSCSHRKLCLRIPVYSFTAHARLTVQPVG